MKPHLQDTEGRASSAEAARLIERVAELERLLAQQQDALDRAESERRASEESLRAGQAALAESEERFRQMAETIRDVFWLFDMRQQRLLYVSPAFDALWGRPRNWMFENVAGWIETVHEEDRQRAISLPRPQAPGKIFDEVYRITRPDGTQRWVHDRRYAAFDEEGQFARLVGVCEDISERHEAADKLQQQAAQLAHVARLSTVGELVASISHEINQPLYAIANFTGAIAAALKSPAGPPAGKLERWNTEIAQAALRAGEIIRRVRSYVSRGAAVRQPIDLVAVVQDSTALLRAEARRERVPIQLDLRRPEAPLLADPGAIQQVLVKPIRNALEASAATPTGERAIWVRTRQTDGHALVSVEDAGSGLSPVDLEHLFSPFYTSKPQGMGLGLPISKTIVEAHHGQIWAEPNAGRGSTFHFTLPLAAPTSQYRSD